LLAHLQGAFNLIGDGVRDVLDPRANPVAPPCRRVRGMQPESASPLEDRSIHTRNSRRIALAGSTTLVFELAEYRHINAHMAMHHAETLQGDAGPTLLSERITSFSHAMNFASGCCQTKSSA